MYSIAVDNERLRAVERMYFCLAGWRCNFKLSTASPSRWVAIVWDFARALLAPLDVRHKNYGLVFLVREIVMTFLQSVQTYRLSCLMSRLWMNHVMASLLVLNCWASPLLQYVFRSRVGPVRLGGVIVNLLLDMASYIALPIALLPPYLKHFIPGKKMFALEVWYTDALFINLINDVQLVFITSLYDATFKCVIALSAARGLHSITKLVCTDGMVIFNSTILDWNEEAALTGSRHPKLRLVYIVDHLDTIWPQELFLVLEEYMLASHFVALGATPLCDRMIAAGETSTEDVRGNNGIYGIDCSFLQPENASVNTFPIDSESAYNPTYS
ncbi:hypothetical protein PybrP1_005447 [[Pythium] brassicae (nom. inval.)]|nr:hypothetical protein PybrP1_005447 [[Pythium] brassicae (nom. inval.)]